METVMSVCHIRVRKCCASCAYKDLTRALSARYCTEHHKNVKPDDCCMMWQISEQLKKAGNALGKVKRYDYLMFALDIRHGEAEKEELGETFEPRSIADIRKEFEQEHGSIYLNI